MTVQYYQDVLTVGTFTFLKLLTRWRGSVVKLVYKDFIVFSVLYTLISCIYRFLLKDDYKRTFEKIVEYVGNLQGFIPITFILGFYLSLVFSRSWKHFNTVPWITKTAMFLASHLNAGSSEDEKLEARLQKRSVIRYLVAAEILTLSRISVPVKRRFPHSIDLYTKGILLEHEVNLIMDTEPFVMQPFLPISWCTKIIIKACDQGKITNELIVIALIKEINRFRHMLQELFLLDHICIPLVYTQVVTIAVYTYFTSCLIGRQFISNPMSDDKNTDFFIPIFTIIQFIVYVGWMKLALALVNPMGEDDEDFDLNTVIDYNYEIGMAIVDNIFLNQPLLIKDKYFNESIFDLPMENQMKDSKCQPFMGSVYNLKVEDDSWITSLKSIVTPKNERHDSFNNDNKSIYYNHQNDLIYEDHHLKIPSRSESNRSNRKSFHIRRQVSTTSSFRSNIIPPITEEENIEILDQKLEVVNRIASTADILSSQENEINTKRHSLDVTNECSKSDEEPYIIEDIIKPVQNNESE